MIRFDGRNLPGEQWRPVRGLERFYSVSSIGRIVSHHRTGDVLLEPIPPSAKTKSPMVRLAGRTRYVARIVAEAFIRPLAHDDYVRHRNGDNTNCHTENLFIVNRRQAFQRAA